MRMNGDNSIENPEELGCHQWAKLFGICAACAGKLPHAKIARILFVSLSPLRQQPHYGTVCTCVIRSMYVAKTWNKKLQGDVQEGISFKSHYCPLSSYRRDAFVWKIMQGFASAATLVNFPLTFSSRPNIFSHLTDFLFDQSQYVSSQSPTQSPSSRKGDRFGIWLALTRRSLVESFVCHSEVKASVFLSTPDHPQSQ